MSGDRMCWGNCLVVAVGAWLREPGRVRLCAQRNKAGRWHIFWQRDGRNHEFYAPGRSQRTYLQNIIYRGRIRTWQP